MPTSHKLRILGIETSCDETAAAVVDESGTIYSDVVHSQIELHRPQGGVVPELAARDHARNITLVAEEALSRAGTAIAAIDAIAVTNRPGLVGALLVGVEAAKGLSWAARKPLVGAHCHLVGHLLAAFLDRGDSPDNTARFPYVALLVSGGHTALYRVDGPLAAQCTELGGTRDDAAGEAFDKVAKMMGLGYPGGPVIDRLAKLGDATRFPFEAPMASTKSLEFSFSGLKTQVAHFLEAHGALSETDRNDVCAAFQSCVTTVLARKLIAAAEREKVDSLVLGGGVAANSELRAKVQQLGAARGLHLVAPHIQNCTDNAAMIAYAGAQRFLAGERDDFSLAATSQTILVRTTRKGRGNR